MDPFTYASKADAIAAFAPNGAPRTFRDERLVLCGDTLLIFARLDGVFARSETPRNGTHLRSPENLEWRPRSRTQGPWLPEEANPLVRPAGRPPLALHLFLGPAGVRDRWLFCGAAHLGSLRDVEDPAAGFEAGISLIRTRIPRARWRELGGYPGWRITVTGQATDLMPDETHRFAKIISAPRRPGDHIEMTRWEGDVLSLTLNAQRGLLVYSRGDADSGLHVRCPDTPADLTERFCCRCCSLDGEFARAATLPPDLAFRVMTGMFQSGISPTPGAPVLPDSPRGSAATWTDDAGVAPFRDVP